MTLRVEGVGHVAMNGPTSGPVQMLFKDGEHTINEAMVAHLGGTEAVVGFRGQCAQVTYQEFVSGFWKLLEKTKVNEMMRGYISSHFRVGRPL